MTTTTLDPTSAAAHAFKRCFSWVTAKVPPHEMTAGERKLKKALFAAVLVPTAVVILLMGELGIYSGAIAKANDTAAQVYAQAKPEHAQLIREFGVKGSRQVSDIDAEVLRQLQARQRLMRANVWEPIPLCWLANCAKLK